MIRALPRLLAAFLVPFAIYLLLLMIRRVNPFTLHLWARRVLALTAAGLGCVVAVLVIVGVTAPRHEGGYVPAHIENGRIVPGQMR